MNGHYVWLLNDFCGNNLLTSRFTLKALLVVKGIRDSTLEGNLNRTLGSCLLVHLQF